MDAEDVDELIADWAAACSEDGPSLWVLKPSRANRGEGIAVLHAGDVTALRAAIAAHPRYRDWLLQEYVIPLLLPREPAAAPPVSLSTPHGTGLKCHLRLHVLAVGALSVWVHKDPLVLVAGELWDAPGESLLQTTAARAGGATGLLAHLTNHCQQARGAEFDEHSQTRSIHESFDAALVASIREQAVALVAATFEPLARGTAAFFPLPHCFELYGFDLAVDRNGRLALLEVNSGPDLSLHGQRWQHTVDALLADALQVITAHLYCHRPGGGAAAALGACLEDAPKGGALHSGGRSPAAQVGDAVGSLTCALSRPCDAPRAELDRFKRTMATVGKFAQSMHEAVGAPVRGVQGLGLRGARHGAQ